MAVAINNLKLLLAKSPPAILERTLMAEYLLTQGYLMPDLKTLPAQVAADLLAEARRFSAFRLAEIEGRDQCPWKMMLPICLN